MPQEVPTRILGVLAPHLRVLQLVGDPPPGFEVSTLFLQRDEEAVAIPITPQEALASALLPLLEEMPDLVGIVTRLTDVLPNCRGLDLLQEEGWRPATAFYENLLQLPQEGPLTAPRFLMTYASFFAAHEVLREGVRVARLTPAEGKRLQEVYLSLYDDLWTNGWDSQEERPPMGFGPTS